MDSLPDELLFLVLEKLKTHTLLKVKPLNKRFNTIVSLIISKRLGTETTIESMTKLLFRENKELHFLKKFKFYNSYYIILRKFDYKFKFEMNNFLFQSNSFVQYKNNITDNYYKYRFNFNTSSIHNTKTDHSNIIYAVMFILLEYIDTYDIKPSDSLYNNTIYLKYKKTY